MNQINTNNNFSNIKIVYKKATDYDNSSNDSSINLDDSVYSNESNENYGLKNNEKLRKDILNEINNDINDINNIDSKLIDNINIDNQPCSINNDNYNYNQNNSYELDYIELFTKYLNDLDIELNHFKKNSNIKNIIKKFILDYKMTEKQILFFLNKLDKLDKIDINENNLDKIDINENNLENFFNSQENIPNKFLNSNFIIDGLYNYDINTWIFIGVIIISITIIIMITINNK